MYFPVSFPAGPTIPWERLLSTQLVTSPVQPPLEGSEIKWLAGLETLPSLVRQLDFTGCTGRRSWVFFPHGLHYVSRSNQAVEDMPTTSAARCLALVMENRFSKLPWPDLFCHTWNKVTWGSDIPTCFKSGNNAAT